jgi:hypothetical protein
LESKGDQSAAEPLRWTVETEKGPSGLGLEVNSKRCRYDYVVVRKVYETGKMAEYNSANPSTACQPGDRLEQVNGIKGAKPLLLELKSAQKLSMQFARVSGGDDPTTSE